MNQAELLAQQIDDTRFWTLRLIDDLKGDDWYYQPGPGLAHALFACGHVAVSQDILVNRRCLGSPLLNQSFCDHFPTGVPVQSKVEHDYPPVERVLETMADIHTKTLDAIRSMSESVFDEPAYGADGKTFHPHYRDKRGAVTHCGRHEAFHAGQLATIRRLLGKSFLR